MTDLTLLDLPPEVLTEILSFIPQPRELLALRLINRQFSELCLVPTLWDTLNLQPYARIQKQHIEFAINDEVVQRLMSQIGSGLRYINLSACDIGIESIWATIWFARECKELRLRNVLISVEAPSQEWIRFQLSGTVTANEFINERDRTAREGSVEMQVDSNAPLSPTSHTSTRSSMVDSASVEDHSMSAESLRDVPSLDVQPSEASEMLARRPNLTMQSLHLLDLAMTLTSSGHLSSLLRMTPLLRDLNLAHCPYMMEMPFDCPLPLLETLNLSGTVITDVGLRRIFQTSPRITSLVIRQCFRITDVSLGHVGQLCPAITSLDTCDCYNVTSAGVEALRRCTNLQQLAMRGCRQVNEDMMEWLANRVSSLRCSMSPLGLWKHHKPIISDGHTPYGSDESLRERRQTTPLTNANQANPLERFLV